mgnify:CR=1 FL=1
MVAVAAAVLAQAVVAVVAGERISIAKVKAAVAAVAVAVAAPAVVAVVAGKGLSTVMVKLAVAAVVGDTILTQTIEKQNVSGVPSIYSIVSENKQ